MRLRPRTTRHLPARLRCELGQSAVELALVIPLFLAMICGIVEFSRLYYTRLTVRDLTQEATRFAVTGQKLTNAGTGTQMTRAASIQSVIQSRATGMKVLVDSVKINPADGGKPGEVVQVRVFYQYQFSLAPLRHILPTSPMYFSAASSMKNEPVFD